MASAKLLIRIGAEGGSIAVYGHAGDLATAGRYKVMIVDQTPTFLNDDERGLAIRQDSGWISTWSAAIQFLDRFPWPDLVGLYVDPSVAQQLWTDVQSYSQRSGKPIQGRQLARWSRVCHPENDT